MEEIVDKITQLVVVIICLGLVGFISVVAAVSLFGPQIEKLMQGLPGGPG